MQCGDKGIRGNDTNQKTYGYMAELLRRRNDGTDFLGLMFHVSMTAGLVVFHRRHGMAIENSAPDTYRGRKSGTKAIVRAKGGQGPGPFSPLCSSPSTSLTSAPGEGCYSAISDGLRPGKTPSLRGDSRAIFSSHESPRSGVNVSGLRPSLIAKHSLRSALGILLSPSPGEGCFQRSATGAAREKRLPFAEIRGWCFRVLRVIISMIALSQALSRALS